MIKLVNINLSTEIVIIYASKLPEDYKYYCRYCSELDLIHDECSELSLYSLCELRKFSDLIDNSENLFNLSIYNILKFHGDNKCI